MKFEVRTEGYVVNPSEVYKKQKSVAFFNFYLIDTK